MVELASRDRPDVLCLQALPLWSLARLDDWGGMTVLSAVAKRTVVARWLGRGLPRTGPLPCRSGGTGQASAILLRPQRGPLEHRTVRISDGGRERRVCHAVRLDGIVVGNVHASNEFRHVEVPRTELTRAH